MAKAKSSSHAAAAAAAAASGKTRKGSSSWSHYALGLAVLALAAALFFQRQQAAQAQDEHVNDRLTTARARETPLGNVSSLVLPPSVEQGPSWLEWRTRDCGETVMPWLYKQRSFSGYHVLCLNPEDGKTSKNLPEAFSVMAFMNGVNSTRSFTMPFGSMTALRGALTRNLDIRPLEGIRQPWALFNRDGRRISSVAEFEPMMLLYEGGQWIWPGIEIGHRWYIRNMNADAADLVIETIELLPLIVEIKNFLRLEECDHIISVASPHFFTSKVAHQDKDIGKDSSEWRTSSQWWYDAKFESKPVMPFIQKRVAELTRVPKSHQEHAQILKYEPGQKYVAHHDYFDLRYYATQKDMIAQYDEGGKNRLATVFWYLSTVTNGGHTNFPMAGGLPHPSNFSDCSKGLSVPPEKGKVIIFYSMTPRGELDEYSLHAGCPPAEGELKYSANFWLWNKPVKF